MPREAKKHILTAIIYDKKGRILSIGQNNYVKTHPLQKKYAEQAGEPHKEYLHAEVAAIVKCKDLSKAYKISIFRFNSEGKPGLAKPCSICEGGNQSSRHQACSSHLNNFITFVRESFMEKQYRLLEEVMINQVANPTGAMVNSESAFVKYQLEVQGEPVLAKLYWSWVCFGSRKGVFPEEIEELQRKLNAIDKAVVLPDWSTYGT